ncbi:MAG: cytochrome P460 family protein [Myxococcota bacterium]
MLRAWWLTISAMAATPTSVAYPEGYRGWNHVKTMEIEAGHALSDPFQGVHHVYVNDTGASALKAGKALPTGTVLAFDLLASVAADHARAEGARKFVGVMVKDPQRYGATGGWGFEVFVGDTRERAVTDGGAGCFTCHQSQASSDYVFSRWRQ